MTLLLLASPTLAADEVRASAWDELRDEDLGRFYDANFEPVRCEQKRIVPTEVAPLRKDLNQTDREFRRASSSDEVSANLRAWGMVSLSGSYGTSTDYGVFRSIELTSLMRVDEDEIGAVDCPTARYYLATIYYGRMYEVAFTGQSKQLEAALSAQGTIASGGISGWAKENGLETRIRTVGLSPVEDGEAAIFAKTEAELRSAYTYAPEPQSILVTFKRVPGATSAATSAQEPARVDRTEGAPAPKAEVPAEVDLASAASVTVRLGKVSYPRVAPSGWSWDPMSGAPDLSVWAKAGGSVVWQSPVAEDSYSYDFGQAVVATVDPKATPSLTFTFADTDVSENDLVGRYVLTFADLAPAPMGVLKLNVKTQDGVQAGIIVRVTAPNRPQRKRTAP